ncbi:serum amyloid P-component-like [Amblyraja radiata]|uniref:serum amyloid P-component-like n=1 Tax=Amblyraja radiata TaxID=386614 RepID=UPI0014035434|nr:serum amyloid P-component-like [Amblyraja radiata]
MKPFVTIVLVIGIYLPGSDSAGLDAKSVIFSSKTSDSFVRLHAAHFNNLTAFTACFRAASEAGHSYSLLSYATSFSDNELLIWEESETQLWLYLGTFITKFYITEMDAILRHICVTWESQVGEITVWVNGRRSIRKIGRGYIVKGSGQFILGQEQDSVGGGFDSKQSFVGEISDVHLWDHVLKPNDIEMISQGCFSKGGNIIDWRLTIFTARGYVRIIDNNDCTF